MNRIVVGTAPSPNLWNTQSRWETLVFGKKNSWLENIRITIVKFIFSRIGSLANANHRPGGGQVA